MQTAPIAANIANPPATSLPLAPRGENAHDADAEPSASPLQVLSEQSALLLPLAVMVIFGNSAWMA